MILIVYAVFDKAVGAYLPPWYARSQGEALRSFADACNSTDSNFGKYAGDYTMYRLGMWNDANGIFEAGDPVRVISAQECRVSSTVPNADAQVVGERTAVDAASWPALSR